MFICMAYAWRRNVSPHRLPDNLHILIVYRSHEYVNLFKRRGYNKISPGYFCWLRELFRQEAFALGNFLSGNIFEGTLSREIFREDFFRDVFQREKIIKFSPASIVEIAVIVQPLLVRPWMTCFRKLPSNLKFYLFIDKLRAIHKCNIYVVPIRKLTLDTELYTLTEERNTSYWGWWEYDRQGQAYHT
jgi:hypothetical protein